MNNLIVRTGTEEDFFRRGRELAGLADRGEQLAEERILSFEDPAELMKLVSGTRLALFRAVKEMPGSITEISARLHRDRSAVKRDVDQLERAGLVTVAETRTGSPAQDPSVLMHNTIRSAWGLDDTGGLINQYACTLPGFDAENLGSVTGALASKYPSDRFGYMVFQADATFSAFSYEKFYDDIKNAPNELARRRALFSRWEPDVANWTQAMNSFSNVAFHVPYFRNFNSSHCLTIVDFSCTGVEDAGVASVGSFVDATLDRGPVMRNTEVDRRHDLTQELSPAIRLVKLLLNWLP